MAVKRVYRISGMTCDHCREAVSKAVEALDGVLTAEVDLGAETLSVVGDVSEVSVQDAVGRAGYSIVGLDS